MNVHYSSKTDNWATPQSFFDRLNAEFNFTLDPCADKDNAKCTKYYTVDDNGLAQDWARERESFYESSLWASYRRLGTQGLRGVA